MVQDDEEKQDGSVLPPEFRTSRAYAVHFPGTEGGNPILVDPANDSLHEITAAGMRGKRCIGCAGSDWFLVLDEVSKECFLTTLFATSPLPGEPETTAVVPLPPMPTAPPHLEFLFNCVLSAPTPTAPGCIVMLGLIAEKYLRYCRAGDEAWSQVDVEFDDEVDTFDGAVAFHGGKIFATTTSACYAVVIDASAPAPAAPRVERTDITIPGPLPSNHPMRQHLVVATTAPDDDGDLYFVRPYFFGFPEEVVGFDICRWDPSQDAWHEIDGIGDVTLFVGSNCLAVSPATEAGTEPNCIHILRSCHDGVRVFTVSLHDRTIRCNFVGIDDDEDDDSDDTSPPPETRAYWSVPNSCRFKLEPSLQGNSESDEERSIARADPGHEQGLECAPLWSTLFADLLVAHVVPKLSFIDFLHLKYVCKDWSRISTPIRDYKARPLLVTPSIARDEKGVSLDVFDPVSKNKHTLSVQIPSVTVHDNSTSLMLHCSRNGWVVVSRGHYSFFLVNPFKRGDGAVVMLPPVHDLFWFKGISFSSTPGSPDFMVMIIEGFFKCNIATVRTWRPGQASWEQHEDFDCVVGFLLATHSPLFLDGEFYCVARDGRLGAFDPKTMTWRILDGLEPIISEAYVTGDEGLHVHLVEWKGEVVAVIRYTFVEEPVDMFRLDRKRMAWSKLEELEDGAVFWDRKQAVARPSRSLAQGFSCNMAYEPTFTETDDGVRECIFYSMETKEYSNCSCSLYGLKEPLNALWLEPNLDDYE